MSKSLFSLFLGFAMALACAACTQGGAPTVSNPAPAQPGSSGRPDAVQILLSDAGITVDGQTASIHPEDAVYVGNGIIYYEDGTDETYGEGSEEEKHSAEEAAAHTVVTITRPGSYEISGALSQGQIFVDLGAEAKTDPEAVVTLILNGVDLTCTVAPAVFF